MKNNSSNLLFLTFMLMGILFSVSSNNWLGCWMGIEINLISFLPIMMDSVSVYSSESMIKYFIVQSMGSGLLFASIIINGIFDILSNYTIMFSLLIKIGCPPFHMWFPSVMEGLSWLNCFLLSTIQKIAIMVLLSYLNLNLIMLFVIISCLWGSIGGLSYSSLRKIIAYSSIYNLGWIIVGISILTYSWLLYFTIYSFTVFMLCYFFYLYNINYLNQFFLLYNSYYSWAIMMVLFMSMGGMPPFLGFVPKMIMIYCLIIDSYYLVSLFLLFSALLVLFFYLRVVFTGLMINSLSLSFMSQNYSILIYLFGIISLFGSISFLMMNLFL
uniref:NADH-ubiquinone oxidoreductase chain 2 n=1 Tax=Chilecicada sp. PL492 TaxID=2219938 RepID=A0A3S5GLA9_9HEMI|nr:NADH dehydrogenase subunit 2 [Chilecicada sp. PL492]